MTVAAMDRQALALLLRLINAPTPYIAGNILYDRFAGVADTLVSAGYLVPAGAQAYLEHPDDRLVGLEWCSRAAAYRYFCTASGWVSVPAAQVKRYAVQMDAVLAWFRGLFEVEQGSRITTVSERLLWHVGVSRFGQQRLHLYLAGRLYTKHSVHTF